MTYYNEPPPEEIIPPRRPRPGRKRRYLPRDPWWFEVEYADGKRIRWEEGVWFGPDQDVRRLRVRVASGDEVPGPVPSSFEPNDPLAVPELLREVLGQWHRVIEDKMPEPSWYENPPNTVY